MFSFGGFALGCALRRAKLIDQSGNRREFVTRCGKIAYRTIGLARPPAPSRSARSWRQSRWTINSGTLRDLKRDVVFDAREASEPVADVWTMRLPRRLAGPASAGRDGPHPPQTNAERREFGKERAGGVSVLGMERVQGAGGLHGTITPRRDPFQRRPPRGLRPPGRWPHRRGDRHRSLCLPEFGPLDRMTQPRSLARIRPVWCCSKQAP